MRRFVLVAIVAIGAIDRIRCRCRYFVFVEVVVMRVMQVAAVKVILVAVVLQARMPAPGAVRVVVTIVPRVRTHGVIISRNPRAV
jgi:hypothetical protein